MKYLLLLCLVSVLAILAIYAHGLHLLPPPPVASVQPTSPPALAQAKPATPDNFEADIMITGMSVYMVTNPHNVELRVQHVYVDRYGMVIYSFYETIPPKTAAPYRMQAISHVPADFDGQVRIYASQPVIVNTLGREPSPTPPVMPLN